MPSTHDRSHYACSISVSPVTEGGWTLVIERDGRLIATEHFTDWHRVERRLACLEIEACPGRTPRCWAPHSSCAPSSSQRRRCGLVRAAGPVARPAPALTGLPSPR